MSPNIPNDNLHQQVREESRRRAEHADADRGSSTGDDRSQRRGRVAASTADSRGGACGSEACGRRAGGRGGQAGGERGAVRAGAGVVLTRAGGQVARAQLLAFAAGDALAPGGLAVVAASRAGGCGARGRGARGRGRHGGAVVARAGVVLARAGGQVAAAELLALSARHAGLVGRLALVAAVGRGGGRGGARGRGGRGGHAGAVVAGAGVVLAGAGREVAAAELFALAAGDARLVGGLAVVRVVRVRGARGGAQLGERGPHAGSDLGCAAGLVTGDLYSGDETLESIAFSCACWLSPEDITYAVARRTALVVVGLALLALRLGGGTSGLVGIRAAAALVEESAAVGDLGHVDLGVGDGGEGRGNEDELHLDGINVLKY